MQVLEPNVYSIVPRTRTYADIAKRIPKPNNISASQHGRSNQFFWEAALLLLTLGEQRVEAPKNILRMCQRLLDSNLSNKMYRFAMSHALAKYHHALSHRFEAERYREISQISRMPETEMFELIVSYGRDLFNSGNLTRSLKCIEFVFRGTQANSNDAANLGAESLLSKILFSSGFFRATGNLLEKFEEEIEVESKLTYLELRYMQHMQDVYAGAGNVKDRGEGFLNDLHRQLFPTRTINFYESKMNLVLLLDGKNSKRGWQKIIQRQKHLANHGGSDLIYKSSLFVQNYMLKKDCSFPNPSEVRLLFSELYNNSQYILTNYFALRFAGYSFQNHQCSTAEFCLNFLETQIRSLVLSLQSMDVFKNPKWSRHLSYNNILERVHALRCKHAALHHIGTQ